MGLAAPHLTCAWCRGWPHPQPLPGLSKNRRPCLAPVLFVICYCLCCGLTDMRQSSTTASHTSDTTAVTAYSTAIKANTFHMVRSFLRNSESVLGPHGEAHCAYFSRLFNQSTNTSTSFGCGGINMVCPFILRSKTLATLANMGC